MADDLNRAPEEEDAALNSAIADMVAERNARLAATSRQVGNADVQAKVIQLARQTGIPADVVSRNVDTLEQKRREREMIQLASENPVLARHLTDPSFATVAQDDLGTLGNIERTVGKIARSAVTGFRTASLQAEATDINMADLRGQELTPAQIARREEIKTQLQAFEPEKRGEGVAGYVPRTTGYSVRQMGSSIFAGVQGSAYGGVAGAALGAPIAGVGAAPGAAVGMVVGGAMGAGLYAYEMEAAAAWDELRNAKDESGKPLDPRIARMAAQAIGVANGTIEVGSDLLMASIIPGASAAIKKALGMSAVREQLIAAARAKPGMAAAMAAGLKTMLGTASVEGLEEFFQQLTGGAIQRVAKSASGQEFAPQPWSQDVAEGLTAAGEAFTGTFFTMLPVGGYAHLSHTRQVRLQEKYAQATEAAKQIEQLQALGTSAKVMARDATTATDFVAQVANEQGDQPTEFYVDATKFSEALNQSGMTVEELKAVAPVSVEQLNSPTGADIRLPVSEFMALTEKVTSPLIDHIRVGDNQPTRAESQAYMTEHGAEMQAIVEEQLKKRDDQDQFRQSLAKIQTDFEGYLNATGKFAPAVNRAYASLISNYYGTQAIRAGMTVEEFTSKYKLGVTSKEMPGAYEQRARNVGGYKVKSENDGGVTVFGDQAEVRSLMPEGVKGRLVEGGVYFTPTSAQRVIAALGGEEVTHGRAGEITDNPRYQGGERAGQYIGAPEQFNTPAKIPRLRRMFMQLAKEGEPGRFWYERSGSAILDMVGGDREEARKFISLLAIYSPQAKVDANSTFALRAWAQYKDGKPISVKTGTQDADAKAVLYDGTQWGGEKTNNFFRNLMREVDAELGRADKQGVTVDMWMMRAAGYDMDSPTQAAYRFVENETNRIAKELGWEPQQVQAAIWVAMKARTENSGVKKATVAESIKSGYSHYEKSAKGATVLKVTNAVEHRKLWLKHAMALQVSEQDTNGAKFDFSDGVRRHMGQVSWEARPGRTTGVLPGIHDAPYHLQAEFQKAIAEALTGSGGNDLLAQKLGLLQEGRIIAPGVWQSDIAAGEQSFFAMAPSKGKAGVTSVDTAQKELLDTYADIMGLLLKQEGVGWHRPFYSSNIRDQNGIELRIGRPLTPVEAGAIWAAVDRELRSLGSTDWESNAGLISSSEGIRVVNFGALPDNDAFQKAVIRAAESVAGFDASFGRFASDGNLLTNDWKENPDGQAYRSRIVSAGRSDVLGWAESVLAPQIQAVHDDFSARYGWGQEGQGRTLSQSGEFWAADAQRLERYAEVQRNADGTWGWNDPRTGDRLEFKTEKEARGALARAAATGDFLNQAVGSPPTGRYVFDAGPGNYVSLSELPEDLANEVRRSSGPGVTTAGIAMMSDTRDRLETKVIQQSGPYADPRLGNAEHFADLVVKANAAIKKIAARTPSIIDLHTASRALQGKAKDSGAGLYLQLSPRTADVLVRQMESDARAIADINPKESKKLFKLVAELSGLIIESRDSQPQFKTGESVTVRAFHGSNTGAIATEGFDPAKLGSNTEAASARKGFFFAGTPDTSNAYVGNPIEGNGSSLFDSFSQGQQDEIIIFAQKEGQSAESMEDYFAELGFKITHDSGDTKHQWQVIGPDADQIDIFPSKEAALDNLIENYDLMDARDIMDHLYNSDAYAEEMYGKVYGVPPPKGAGTPVVYAARLHMRNPYVHDYKGEHYREESYNDVLKKAKKAGHDSVILLNTYDGGPLDNIFVVFDADQVEQNFYQGGNNPLAQFHIPMGGVGEGQSLISLLEGANWSGFIHESGHFFLEVQADLASKIQLAIDNGESVSASERGIVDDMNVLLKWFGVQGTDLSALDTWASMTLDQKRQHHEQFARGFEAFSMEGRSPSLELQAVFSKFRSWLYSVYKALKNLNVDLTDEVRGVMGRMIASDIAIEEAESARNMMPMVKSLEEAKSLGWSKDQYDAYQARAQIPTEQAITELNARAMQDMQWLSRARSKAIKEMQDKAESLRSEIRAQVRSEVFSEPVYQAWQFLTGKGDQTGQVVDFTGSGKLRTEYLRQMYGNEESAVWRKLSALRMTSDTIGIDPETVASGFGFDSADALVQTLASSLPPNEVVDARTDQRMLAENGDLDSPEALQKAADRAVHNEARARFIASELKALQAANKIPGKTNALAKAAKEYAAELIGRMKIRDIRVGQFTSAETRNGKLAEKAFASAKLEEAAMHKRNQLVNHQTAAAAMDALEEVDKTTKYFRKFPSKSIDQAYQDQIDQLLERFSFKPESLKDIDRRASLSKWLADQEEIGNVPNIDPDLIESAGKKSFKDMTLEELRSLEDAVRQIEHLGRLKNRLLKAKDKREFDAIKNEMAVSIREHGGEIRPIQYEATPVRSFAEGFLAVHRKLSSLFRQMDGLKNDNGPMWRYVVQGMNEQGTEEDVRNEKATIALQELYKPIVSLKGGLKGSKVFIKEINASLSRGARLSVALNWGNEDNRQRLLGDYEGGNHWTEAQVRAIMKSLSPAELKFVNDIWAHIDSYWDDIAAKQKRLTGVEPKKVIAAPVDVTASDGSTTHMNGGYYPLVYDPGRSLRAQTQNQEQIAAEAKRGAVTAATTRMGHTKERLKQVKRPVLLDLNVITRHIAQVNHDLAWHEWFIDTNRIMRSHEVSEAIKDHYGVEVMKTIKSDLDGIATGDAKAQERIAQLGMLVRSNVSRATMGFSATTALLQPFGLTQSMSRIGTKHVLQGAARWAGDAIHLDNSFTWIAEQSDFMRLRSKTFTRELREINSSVGGQSKFMQVADAGLFMFMRKMQLVADIPTWLGQYQKSQDEGLSHEDSVAQADRAVLESQGGGQLKDLSQVQRDHPFLTQFYSYFSVTANLMIESTQTTDFKNPKAIAGWMSDMALLSVVPAIVPALLLYLLKGGGDDDESIAWKIARWQLSYLLGTAVVLRETGGMVEGFDYTGPPVFRPIVEFGKVVKQVKQGEFDEGLVIALARSIGVTFGLPVTQLVRSYQGWKAWEDGEEGAGPQSILFGPPPKK
jgi:hypothetical protein